MKIEARNKFLLETPSALGYHIDFVSVPLSTEDCKDHVIVIDDGGETKICGDTLIQYNYSRDFVGEKISLQIVLEGDYDETEFQIEYTAIAPTTTTTTTSTTTSTTTTTTLSTTTSKIVENAVINDSTLTKVMAPTSIISDATISTDTIKAKTTETTEQISKNSKKTNKKSKFKAKNQIFTTKSEPVTTTTTTTTVLPTEISMAQIAKINETSTTSTQVAVNTTDQNLSTTSIQLTTTTKTTTKMSSTERVISSATPFATPTSILTTTTKSTESTTTTTTEEFTTLPQTYDRIITIPDCFIGNHNLAFKKFRSYRGLVIFCCL